MTKNDADKEKKAREGRGGFSPCCSWRGRTTRGRTIANSGRQQWQSASRKKQERPMASNPWCFGLPSPMAAGGGVGVFCFLRPLDFPMREDGLACIEGAVGRSSREGDLAAMAPAVVLPEPVVVNCFFDLRRTAGEEPPPACFFFHFVVRDLDDAKLHRMETVRLVGVRPTPSNLPCPSGSVTKMPWYNNLKPPHQLKRHVKDAFKHFDFHDLDLPEKMLTLDPSKRISANEALDSEYFWADPLPCDPKSLPTYEASHEYQTKKRRQQQRQADDAAAKWQKTIHIYM